jgi:hypothetical protein
MHLMVQVLRMPPVTNALILLTSVCAAQDDAAFPGPSLLSESTSHTRGPIQTFSCLHFGIIGKGIFFNFQVR